MTRKAKKNYYSLKLILFSALYLFAGYTGHNTLYKATVINGVERVNDCIVTTRDLVVCMKYFDPQGWEKLVRF